MPVSKEDVRDAYRLLLGRSPESEATIDSHTVHADVPALVRFILDADEFRSRNGVVRPHPHHIYRGYTAADLDVLHQFERFSGPGCPGFVTSFLGTRYRVGFAPGLLSVDGSVENYPEPGGSYQGETAEFIGTLRSVLDARDGRYRMLECGAGYGTWMAVSYAAAIQKGLTDIYVYGVEADEGHYAFLHQHMSDNNIADYTAFYGGIGAQAGGADWVVSDDPTTDYGGALSIVTEGRPTKHIEVFDLASILDKEPSWDLVHVDIQGSEADLCGACIGAITSKVRRVVIGTHSRKIDGDLMSTFFAAGWVLESEKPTIFEWSQNASALEQMAKVDGVQVWRNPHLNVIGSRP